uniref:J domain-containing protein n=1 Tax=Globisporangium ultimum (strain ATCC 200006 / CBS 805.95 / DAOM BR144) TaxID=431595 RepID=K3WQ64_GLOUD
MRSRRTTDAHRSSVLRLLVLLAAWCVLTAASRVILQTQVPILHPSSRKELKVLELFADEEPVDTLESFRLRFRQDRQWRSNILPQLCQHVRCRRDVPVVFATAIRDAQGRTLGRLEIFEDQEPIDALVAFSLLHQGMVSREDRVQILSAVCRKPGMRCTRSRALMNSQRISGENNSTLGVLEIYDDLEPVDQIYRFVVDHNLPKQALQQLLSAFCGTGRIPCARSHPLVYLRPITTEDGRDLGRLEIPLDEEPADMVYMFGLHHGLGKEFRHELLRRVCADKYVQCNRDGAYVFAAPIKLENGTIVGTLKIMEDEELADAVYHFAKETNITVDVRVSILEALCGRDGITCTRGQALLKALPVGNGESGGLLGVIHVFEGQEPADVVYEFAQRHGLSNEDQLMLLEMICGTSASALSTPPTPASRSARHVDLVCNRYAPVAFTVPIAAPNGTRLGVLELLLNEEPADAIARFGNKYGLSSEEKLNIWSAVCKASGIPCTRSKGLIYQIVYTLPGTDTRERLDFMDGEEPTDIIFEYGKMRNLTLRQRKQLLHRVCNEPRRRPNCTRAEPMLLQIPVWETQDKKMGDLEILEGQEPIDMVYAFLEKHDLFQTEPLNTTLLEVVCNSTTRVTCSRKRPRRILFSMQATYAGIQHTLQYVRPESDWICEQQPHGGQKCVHYVEILTKEFCATHMFEWSGCELRILDALRTQLEAYETAMWRGKDLYAKLGLVKSASREEIDAAYNTLVKRFNNETEPYKYEKLQEAYKTLSDTEEKYFYDLPCLKLFGLCGKKKKDGSISITAD